MNRLSKWWMAAAAGVVLAGIVGIGAVTAQTPVPGTSTTGSTFLARVAEKLGIDTSTLDTAIKDTKTEDIDARVASGELTQAQADEMKQRIADAPADAPFFGGGHGPGMGHGGGFADPAALADFLGITTDQLRTESTADGATLATVAAAHGKSRDELKAFLTEQANTHLDEEVADGRLTQAEADTKLADITANLDARIDGAIPAGHGPGGPGGFRGDGSITPGATATPSTNNG